MQAEGYMKIRDFLLQILFFRLPGLDQLVHSRHGFTGKPGKQVQKLRQRAGVRFVMEDIVDQACQPLRQLLSGRFIGDLQSVLQIRLCIRVDQPFRSQLQQSANEVQIHLRRQHRLQVCVFQVQHHAVHAEIDLVLHDLKLQPAPACIQAQVSHSFFALNHCLEGFFRCHFHRHPVPRQLDALQKSHEPVHIRFLCSGRSHQHRKDQDA